MWLLGKTTDLVVRTFGGNPNAAAEQLSPEELKDLVVGHRGLNAEQRTIITGALEIRERLLREVLVPRREVFILSIETSDRAGTAGARRVPVTPVHRSLAAGTSTTWSAWSPCAICSTTTRPWRTWRGRVDLTDWSIQVTRTDRNAITAIRVAASSILRDARAEVAVE